jgi:hypothetical protein
MDGVPCDVKMEIIELKCSHFWLFDFRSEYIALNTVPAVQSRGPKMVSIFGITYFYTSSFFQGWRMLIPKQGPRITKTRLENSLRIADPARLKLIWTG